MTKEELKLEAIRYLENFKDCAKCKHRWGDCADELDEDCLINNCYSATPKEQDIYLAEAEPREKRIAELEKENAELKSDNEARKFAMAMSEKVEKQLREENAELEKQTNYAKLYYQEVVSLQNQLKTLKDKYEEVKKNNIKAKKILKNIADNWKGSGLNAEKSRKILKSYNDAEMFFKEIKEK